MCDIFKVKHVPSVIIQESCLDLNTLEMKQELSWADYTQSSDTKGNQKVSAKKQV